MGRRKGHLVRTGLTMSKRIIKVGLCLQRGDTVLLARSRGESYFQIPGGKIEPGETDLEALAREVQEELSVELDTTSATYLETFEAPAAGRPNVTLELRLFGGKVAGEPAPASEIAELCWQSLTGELVECTDVIRAQLLPYLARNKVSE